MSSVTYGNPYTNWYTLGLVSGGNRYSDDERTTALEMLKSGMGVGEVSRAMGISKTTLRRWRSEVRPGQTATPPDGERNSDGTFAKGNTSGSNGASSAVQRAKTLAQDLSEQGVKKLWALIERSEQAHIADADSAKHGYLLLSSLKELLDRGLGKPAQAVEPPIAAADAGDWRGAAHSVFGPSSVDPPGMPDDVDDDDDEDDDGT